MSASGGIFAGYAPKNMKGVIFAMREMYNALKATNLVGLDSVNGILQATPVEDIRIAVSETLLNLMDVVELANVFNLSKEELFGKLVVIPFEADAQDYDPARIVVYDRKALGRGTRLFEYSQDVIGKGLYTNHYLTTERCYFYNPLFKCISLDVTSAMQAEFGEVMEATEFYSITETLSHVKSSNKAESIIEGKTFKAVYEADEGYTLTGASVSVTMDGNAVANAYDDGVITIANVSGDLAISITAVEE